MGFLKNTEKSFKMRTIAIVFALSMILAVNAWNKTECAIFQDTSKAILGAANKCAKVGNATANGLLHSAISAMQAHIPKCRRRMWGFSSFTHAISHAAHAVAKKAKSVGKKAAAAAKTVAAKAKEAAKKVAPLAAKAE